MISYDALSETALSIARELFQSPHTGEVGPALGDVVAELKAAGIVSVVEKLRNGEIRSYAFKLTDEAKASGPPSQ